MEKFIKNRQYRDVEMDRERGDILNFLSKVSNNTNNDRIYMMEALPSITTTLVNQATNGRNNIK